MELIEARRVAAKPLFSRLTLSRLGDHRCLRETRYNSCSLEQGVQKILADECGGRGFDTRGIWGGRKYLTKVHDGSEQHCLWGLTSSSEWVLVFLYLQRKSFTEVGEHITICKSDLSQILAIWQGDSRDILQALGGQVSRWYHDHRELAKLINTIHTSFQEDDELLRLMKA